MTIRGHCLICDKAAWVREHALMKHQSMTAWMREVA